MKAQEKISKYFMIYDFGNALIKYYSDFSFLLVLECYNKCTVCTLVNL